MAVRARAPQGNDSQGVGGLRLLGGRDFTKETVIDFRFTLPTSEVCERLQSRKKSPSGPRSANGSAGIKQPPTPFEPPRYRRQNRHLRSNNLETAALRARRGASCTSRKNAPRTRSSASSTSGSSNNFANAPSAITRIARLLNVCVHSSYRVPGCRHRRDRGAPCSIGAASSSSDEDGQCNGGRAK